MFEREDTEDDLSTPRAHRLVACHPDASVERDRDRHSSGGLVAVALLRVHVHTRRLWQRQRMFHQLRQMYATPGPSSPTRG